jgi:hypothetical protein
VHNAKAPLTLSLSLKGRGNLLISHINCNYFRFASNADQFFGKTTLRLVGGPCT